MKHILTSLLLTASIIHAADDVTLQQPLAPQPQPKFSEPKKTVTKLEGRQATAAVRMGALLAENEGAVPNPLIDYDQFLKISQEVAPVRAQRRLTEEQFAAMAAEPGTVVLDARSADKFELRHIRGAVILPFTDFTEDALSRVIPAKDTRVLIYCNNNFRGAPRAFASKMDRASLNISTYIALATYGYTNVYELGPLLDIKTTKLLFAGTEVAQSSAAKASR